MLVVYLALACFPARVDAGCGTAAWRALSGAAKGVGKWGLTTTLKTPVYPVLLPIQLFRLGSESKQKQDGWKALYKVPFRFFVRDGVPFLLSAFWWGSYGLARGLTITTNEMNQYAIGPDDDGEDEIVYFVNTFNGEEEEEQEFHLGIENYYQLRKRQLKAEVIKINPLNEADLDKKLEELSKKHGKGAIRIELYGHGFNGGYNMGSDRIGVAELTAPNARKMSGVVKPGGKMVFYTCWTARGPEGEAVSKAIGDKYLDQGGKVYTSYMTLMPSPFFLTDVMTAPLQAWKGTDKKDQDYRPAGEPKYRLGVDRIRITEVEKRKPVPTIAPAAPAPAVGPPVLLPNLGAAAPLPAPVADPALPVNVGRSVTIIPSGPN